MISHPTSQSTPSTADKKSRDEHLYWSQALSVGLFSDYKCAALSLHPSKRYAGTGVLIKKGLKDLVKSVTYDIPQTPASLGSPSVVSTTSNTSSTSKSSSTTSKSSKSSTLHQFFRPSPTKSNPKKKQRINGPESHDPEGRIILLELPSFFILHCYVPNNGSNPDSFNRRIRWDERIKAFMGRVKREGGWKGKGGRMKGVYYCGDLNVTPELEIDTSHPTWMRKQMLRQGDVGNSGQVRGRQRGEKRSDSRFPLSQPFSRFYSLIRSPDAHRTKFSVTPSFWRPEDSRTFTGN